MTKPKGPNPQQRKARRIELQHRARILLDMLHENQTELETLERSMWEHLELKEGDA